MLTREQVKQFEVDGFLKGNALIRETDVELLRVELDAVLEGRTTRKPLMLHNLIADNIHREEREKTIMQVFNIWMASDEFLKLAGNTDICKEVSQLCNSNILRIWHDQIQYKPPLEGGTTPWHQDYASWKFIEPTNMVTAWIALDDVVIENGCMWMVKGSHKWGDQSAHIGYNDQFIPFHKRPELLPPGMVVEAVPIMLKKGEVSYHHCLTWHGSPNNISHHKRRGVAIHYMNGESRYVPKDKRHPSEIFIEVKSGEKITGKYFPTVYTDARLPEC